MSKFSLTPLIVPTVVSVGLVAATLEPLVRAPADDGFPLSTYPMFAFERPTVFTLSYAIGETRTGERVAIPPIMVGSREVMQAFMVFDGAVRRGGGSLSQLCEGIAARVAADDDYAEVAQIRIVTGTHDAIAYLTEQKRGKELTRITCRVKR